MAKKLRKKIRTLKAALKRARAEAEKWMKEACGAKAVLHEVDIELYTVKRERDFLIKRLGAAAERIRWNTPNITPIKLKANPHHPLHEYLTLISETIFSDVETVDKPAEPAAETGATKPRRGEPRGDQSR